LINVKKQKSKISQTYTWYVLQGCDLSSRVAQLHATLETLKRESEQKIIKLKAENEEATRYTQLLESRGTVPLQLVL
jgi:hypothetical protein